ncbi:MAG: hypothetical protein PHP98_03850 [Kiritimatiellae bacterium]|nr:hypothetical protein [Kiritimatiellia bacterium]
MNDSKPIVKFGEWIQGGLSLYRDNFVVLVVANLIAAVLSAVTMGILFGPMLAGLIVIILAIIDKKEPKAEIGDVFKGFEYFLDAFLFVIVWGAISIVLTLLLNLIPCAGQVLSIFVSIVISALVMFGMFLIVDRKMNFWPASLESINLVKTNFFPFAGLLVVAMVLGYVGALACGIGMIITMPIGACIIAAAYRDLFGRQENQTQQAGN